MKEQELEKALKLRDKKVTQLIYQIWRGSNCVHYTQQECRLKGLGRGIKCSDKYTDCPVMTHPTHYKDDVNIAGVAEPNVKDITEPGSAEALEDNS